MDCITNYSTYLCILKVRGNHTANFIVSGGGYYKYTAYSTPVMPGEAHVESGDLRSDTNSDTLMLHR